LVRRKHVITKPTAAEPAATALWQRTLLSTEVEELRRGRCGNTKHHRQGDG
jgi:hypothetical protein